MKQTQKILSLAALLSFSTHHALTARSVAEEVQLNSPASVFAEDRVNLSIEGGLLLWRAYQEDLSCYANGEVHELSPSLQRGFRVSIAPVLPHDDWNLFAQWTRLRNSTSNELCNKNGLSPLLSPVEAPFFAPYTTKNEWQIRIDLLQVEQGRPFFIGKSLIIDPFIGLLGTILQQQTHIETQFSSSLAPLSAVASESDLFHRFRGFGPRGGIRVRCPMGKEMSFLAVSALSLLYGHYRVEAESCSSACFALGSETQTSPSHLRTLSSRQREPQTSLLGSSGKEPTWKRVGLLDYSSYGINGFFSARMHLSESRNNCSLLARESITAANFFLARVGI